MRTVRLSLGVVLLLVSGPALLAGLSGWVALGHRAPDGAFTATLTPIRSTGYAVVVTDVGDVLNRNGIDSVLRSGRLQVTVSGSTDPLLLGLAAGPDVRRYLDGVARTDVTGVGFASGPLPVDTVQLAGDRTPAPPAGLPLWQLTSGHSIELAVPPRPGLSLVVMRADGQPGLDVTLAVGHYSGWLAPVTWLLLVAAVAATMMAAALVYRGIRPREPLVVVEADTMLRFADRIADGLQGRAAAGPGAAPRFERPVAAISRDAAGRDGAPVGAHRPGHSHQAYSQQGQSHQGHSQPGHSHPGQSRSMGGPLDLTGEFVLADPFAPDRAPRHGVSNAGRTGRLSAVQAAAASRRGHWRDRRSDAGALSVVADDDQWAAAAAEQTGESPYVTTAT